MGVRWWVAKIDRIPNPPALQHSVWLRGMPFRVIKNIFFLPSFAFIDLHPPSLAFIGLTSTLGWWIRLRRSFRLRMSSADKTADRTGDMGVAWCVAKFDHLPNSPALQHSVGLFGVPNSSVSG